MSTIYTSKSIFKTYQNCLQLVKPYGIFRGKFTSSAPKPEADNAGNFDAQSKTHHMA